MTEDGGYRAIAARLTDTARQASSAQSASGSVAARVAEVLAGAVLVRETLAPMLRVQVLLKGARGGSVFADAFPDGMTRALVRTDDDGEVALGEGAMIQIVRRMPRGRTHESSVDISAVSRLSDAFTAYLRNSAQFPGRIVVEAVMSGDEIEEAGGYVIQPLPELVPEIEMVMEERLKDFAVIDAFMKDTNADPKSLVYELFYAMPYQDLSRSQIFFGCNCSAERVRGSLKTLSASEIESMFEEEDEIEITCDYCQATYRIGPEL